MPTVITSGRKVRDLVAAGYELWHVSTDALPGRWELRRRSERETLAVHWDAIDRVRQRYRLWFEANTTSEQVGRYTWCYRPRQAGLPISDRRAA